MNTYSHLPSPRQIILRVGWSLVCPPWGSAVCCTPGLIFLYFAVPHFPVRHTVTWNHFPKYTTFPCVLVVCLVFWEKTGMDVSAARIILFKSPRNHGELNLLSWSLHQLLDSGHVMFDFAGLWPYCIASYILIVICFSCEWRKQTSSSLNHEYLMVVQLHTLWSALLPSSWAHNLTIILGLFFLLSWNSSISRIPYLLLFLYSFSFCLSLFLINIS